MSFMSSALTKNLPALRQHPGYLSNIDVQATEKCGEKQIGFGRVIDVHAIAKAGKAMLLYLC